MAHALRLSIVAEGVETGEALDFLRSASCDEVQGYFLARPLKLHAFETYLSALPALDARNSSRQAVPPSPAPPAWR